MTTTTTTFPAWLNIDAVLTAEDRDTIRQAEQAARQTLEAVVALRAVVQPVKDRWQEAVWSQPEDGFALAAMLEETTGYGAMEEALLLASDVLGSLWDDDSTATDEYLDKLRGKWAPVLAADEEAKIR